MLFNLGKRGLPPQLWAPPSTKHRKNPATPEPEPGFRTPFHLVCPSGVQGCYVNCSLGSGSFPRMCAYGATITLPQFLPTLEPWMAADCYVQGLHQWGAIPKTANVPKTSEHSRLCICVLISEREKGVVCDPCGTEVQCPMGHCQACSGHGPALRTQSP